MERDIEVDVPHESLEPHGNIALEDLLIQWNEIREKLPGLLAEIKPEKKDDPVFQHPYGGPLDLSPTPCNFSKSTLTITCAISIETWRKSN